MSSLCTVLSPLFALVSSQSYLFLSASVAGGSVAVQHPSDGNGINWKIRVAVRRGSDREEGGSKKESVIKVFREQDRYSMSRYRWIEKERTNEWRKEVHFGNVLLILSVILVI